MARVRFADTLLPRRSLRYCSSMKQQPTVPSSSIVAKSLAAMGLIAYYFSYFVAGLMKCLRRAQTLLGGSEPKSNHSSLWAWRFAKLTYQVVSFLGLLYDDQHDVSSQTSAQ